MEADYWDTYHYGRSAGSNVSVLEERRKQVVDRRNNKNFERFIDMCNNRWDYTPDIDVLKKSGVKYFPMFLYGAEQRGYPYGDLMKNALYFGKARTAFDDRYHLFQVHGRPYDVFAAEQTEEFSKKTLFPRQSARGISGELFGVTLRDLCMMDYRYSATVLSHRVKILVNLDHGDNKSVRALTYMFNPNFIGFLPEHGNNAVKYTRWILDRNGKYYTA